jgi:hypothetical protein
MLIENLVRLKADTTCSNATTKVRRLSSSAFVVCALLLGGCEASAPGTTSEPGAANPPAAAAPAAAEPRTVADIFPPGAAREQVMNSCGSCHNVACAAIGQRTAQRWDALRDGHKEHMQGADLTAVFAYLKSHFDDSKPAPVVPARFLEGGCTPF